MNGGRLSDDEAFFLGIRQFRQELDGGGHADVLQRSLRMIAVRYPEEAEQMQAILEASEGAVSAGDRQRFEEILVQVERQYQEDFAE